MLIFGRWCQVPRLVAWHGDPGASYRYSGTDHHPEPWTPALERVRAKFVMDRPQSLQEPPPEPIPTGTATPSHDDPSVPQ